MLKGRSASLLSSLSVIVCRCLEIKTGRHFLNVEVGKAEEGQEPGSVVRSSTC